MTSFLQPSFVTPIEENENTQNNVICIKEEPLEQPDSIKFIQSVKREGTASTNIKTKKSPCDWKGNLNKHKVFRHAATEKIKWLHCPHCSFKAKLKNHLESHMMVNHGDSEEITCSCGDKIRTASPTEIKFSRDRFKRKAASNLHVAKTKEIPVFIDSKLCWRRIPVQSGSEENGFQCAQCDFKASDKVAFKRHVLRNHTVTEFKEEDDSIVKKTYKTRDVTVLVDRVPCVKKVIDYSLTQE